MAIEIVSKSKFKTPPLSLFLVIICVIMVVVLASTYIFFIISLRGMDKEIQNKEQATVALTHSIIKKETEIIPLRNKISDYGLLIGIHKSPLDIFKILEENSLPTVWFPNFEFDTEENQVILSGHTESFEVLEQQISVLKKEPLLTKITLSDIIIAEEGGIDFTLQLSFKPEVFNPTF